LPGDPEREHTPPPASDPTDAAPQGEALGKFETGVARKKFQKVFDSKDDRD